MSGALAEGKLRWGALLAVTALVLVAAGIYAVGAYQRFEESRTAASSVGITASQPLPAGPFILFRNTASGQGYGNAATVPLASPDGTRAVSGQEWRAVWAAWAGKRGEGGGRARAGLEVGPAARGERDFLFLFFF